MRLFGRKKKQAIDFGKYDIRISIAALCMYEKMSGRSFFNIMEEDIVMLLYCAFCITNNVEIKYETFLVMLEGEETSRWVAEKYQAVLGYIGQFGKVQGSSATTEESGETKEMKMTDIATSLIVDYHLDAHYVMYEMKLWEIEPLYAACEVAIKRRYEEKRLWTYLDMLPHIDSNKVKGPADLIPFPWEDKDKKKEKDLEQNTAAAVAFLGGNRDGER